MSEFDRQLIIDGQTYTYTYDGVFHPDPAAPNSEYAGYIRADGSLVTIGRARDVETGVDAVYFQHFRLENGQIVQNYYAEAELEMFGDGTGGSIRMSRQANGAITPLNGTVMPRQGEENAIAYLNRVMEHFDAYDRIYGENTDLVHSISAQERQDIEALLSRSQREITRDTLAHDTTFDGGPTTPNSVVMATPDYVGAATFALTTTSGQQVQYAVNLDGTLIIANGNTGIPCTIPLTLAEEAVALARQINTDGVQTATEAENARDMIGRLQAAATPDTNPRPNVPGIQA